MSDAMSNYLEGEVIDHLFRAGTFAKPSAIYVGLVRYYEASKIEAFTGTTIGPKELGAAGDVALSYARVAVTQNDSNWSAATTAGATSNAADITFNAATGDWGMVSGVFVVDASGKGNVLLHGALSTPRDVKSGDIFKFNAGDLDVTFT
jgi:hypothetical protein